MLYLVLVICSLVFLIGWVLGMLYIGSNKDLDIFKLIIYPRRHAYAGMSKTVLVLIGLTLVAEITLIGGAPHLLVGCVVVLWILILICSIQGVNLLIDYALSSGKVGKKPTDPKDFKYRGGVDE